MTEWARKNFSWSFSSLLILQALAVAVPLLALVGFLLLSINRDRTLDASERWSEIASLVAADLDATLLATQRTLEQVAREPDVRALDPRRRPRILDLWLERDPTYLNFEIVNLDGIVLHATIGETHLVARDVSRDPEFVRFKRNPTARILPPTISPITGKWQIAVIEPIRNSGGDVLGCVAAELEFDRLQYLVTQPNLPPGGVITVLDSTGIVVARSVDAPAWIGKSVAASAIGKLPIAQGPLARPVAGLDGVQRIYGISRCRTAPWRVLVGVPPAIQLRAARDQFATLLWGAILVAALSALLGIVMSRRIGKSCVDLVAATHRHARGEFGALAPVRGPREMREVAASFNHMVEARQRITADLDSAHSRIGSARQEILNIIEGISDAFVACDRNFVYTYVNRKAGELLGNPPEQLVGRNMWEIYPEGLGQIFQRNYAAALREQTFRAIEEYYPPWDRWFENRIFPTPDGLLIFFSDTTKHRAEMADRLELEGRARRNEMLAAMGALVARVAHESRSPLFGITATVDVLRRECEGQPGVTQYFDSLKLATDQLGRLMSDLLDYARPPREETQQVDLSRAVRTAVQMCQSQAETAVVQVSTAGNADFLVVADEERLALAFRNLIANAIAHSPQRGTVLIEFGAVRGPERDTVQCRVSDQGPGFQAEHLARAFEPFFTTRPTGTGLGLFIVKRIIEDAGGSVEVGNHPEGGACVVVRLPTVRLVERRGTDGPPATVPDPGRAA